jgi:hypothetical protein
MLVLIPTNCAEERYSVYERERGTCSVEKDRKCYTSEYILPCVGMNIRL